MKYKTGLICLNICKLFSRAVAAASHLNGETRSRQNGGRGARLEIVLISYLSKGIPLLGPVRHCGQLGPAEVCGQLSDDLILLQHIGLTLQPTRIFSIRLLLPLSILA